MNLEQYQNLLTRKEIINLIKDIFLLTKIFVKEKMIYTYSVDTALTYYYYTIFQYINQRLLLKIKVYIKHCFYNNLYFCRCIFICKIQFPIQ